MPNWLSRFRKTDTEKEASDGFDDVPSSVEKAMESDVEDSGNAPRFVYEPNHFDRLRASMGLKTRLKSSRIICIKYAIVWKWGLLGTLFFIAVFMTPSLLPQWLGFRWSTTRDLCRSPTAKLGVLRARMAVLSNESAGRVFVQRAERAAKCMDNAARETWHGRGRIKYPIQCVSDNAREKTFKRRVCVGGEHKKKCAKWMGLALSCAAAGIPRTCKTVTTRDDKAVRRLAAINTERDRQHREAIDAARGNLTDGRARAREFAETANKSGEALVARLVRQVDVASNLYLGYTFLAVLVGTPVVIFKREIATGVMGFLLSLTKVNFIILVVAVWTLYDTGLKLMLDVDFPRLLSNFRADPCYLDPTFSKDRLELIGQTCGNITQQQTQVERATANMSEIYYRSALCEVCGLDAPLVRPHANATLVKKLSTERNRYAEANTPDYVFPGSCNATALNAATSTPPVDRARAQWFEAVLSSGILAQILLKGVLTNFATHFVGFMQPMALHSGKVEVFDMDNDDLTLKEENAVRAFARDKHLVALFIASVMLALEVAIIAYSIVSGRSAATIDVIPLPMYNESEYAWICNVGQLVRNSTTA